MRVRNGLGARGVVVLAVAVLATSAHAQTSPSPATVPPSWPASLPAPAVPAPGPIAVVGYPRDVRMCLPDPAHHAGFTKDGAELGYCASSMYESCSFLDASGKRRWMDAEQNPSVDGPGEDPKKRKVIDAFLKDSGLPKLAKNDCDLRPPPLMGTWPYPDITIRVMTGAASPNAQPFVRLGGSIPDGKGAEDAPVYPITITAPRRPVPHGGEIIYNVAELNALQLSPDGKELGVVVHSNCMEWCDDFELRRIPVGVFASLVYNDAGFRAYTKGDLARAVTLFAKASLADDTRDLPAYNLACAYARLGDAPKSEAALARAIARGGDPVVTRARKDKDFDSVRSAAWFTKLVPP